jgi:oxaloacetate decarboxylase gamma subunit
LKETLITQGVDLMLFGMGTVFVFLTALVGITSLMSYIVNIWFPEDSDLEMDGGISLGLQTKVDPQIVQAIQVALDQHRGR